MAVSGFVPADEENPTLGDIARAVNQVHSCVDGFRAEQSKVNAEAKKKLIAFGKTLDGVGGQVRILTSTAGALKTQQEIDGGRITKLAQLFGAEQLEPGEKKPKGRGIATWGVWKVAGALGGIIAGGVFFYQMMVAVAPAIHAYLMSLRP